VSYRILVLPIRILVIFMALIGVIFLKIPQIYTQHSVLNIEPLSDRDRTIIRDHVLLPSINQIRQLRMDVGLGKKTAPMTYDPSGLLYWAWEDIPPEQRQEMMLVLGFSKKAAKDQLFRGPFPNGFAGLGLPWPKRGDIPTISDFCALHNHIVFSREYVFPRRERHFPWLVVAIIVFLVVVIWRTGDLILTKRSIYRRLQSWPNQSFNPDATSSG